MFPLGHLGLGLQTAKPFRRDRPLKPLLLGTLLPDLIDKPLYYGLSLATGHSGADLGLIAGTRSFGHTVLFTAALAALARARRSKTLAALALGSATHLLLDLITDMSESGFDGPRLMSQSVKTLVWPLMGVQ
ncbi:MAG: metal-dependent hydrolase, partial [Elusimicrobia bacterium]|nr:metal-dependent hydrolase [Elusimicrobiota bacterium]